MNYNLCGITNFKLNKYLRTHNYNIILLHMHISMNLTLT